MLVYGDHVDEVEPRAALEALDARLRAAREGHDREALVAGLIEAGRLAQGLLDAEFHALGCDDLTPLSRAWAAFLRDLAREALFEAPPAISPDLSRDLPPRVSLKLPEGFAFYAVHPALYAAAAKSAPRAQAIGIRSIGTTLAAAVAAAQDGPPPLFVRPVGHPFERHLAMSPDFERALAPAATYAIVDEGPGLSGSSMSAVADALLRRGVPPERIHLFPSHEGAPGPAATSRTRELWSRLPRHVARFDPMAAVRAAEDLIGHAEEVRDLSGGAWRALRSAHESDWPASNVQQERRKLLVRTARGAFLLKYAGLGDSGEAVLRRTRALGALVPKALGLRHGFLVQRWHEGAGHAGADLDHVARYAAFRSRVLPGGTGASPAELLAMAEQNTREALGEDFAERVRGLREHLPAIERATVRIESDNRMHAQEWLRLGDGRVLKADAADHCRAHDLVGSQDAAWDLAGGSIELGLEEIELVRRFRARGGRGAADPVLRLARIAYPAFQLGAHAMARDALATMPAEHARLDAAARRYATVLRARLSER